jgi:hypothetical protein
MFATVAVGAEVLSPACQQAAIPNGPELLDAINKHSNLPLAPSSITVERFCQAASARSTPCFCQQHK